MLELYQNEEDPGCARVRLKLAQMRLDYLVRNTGPDPSRMDDLELPEGHREVPVLVDPQEGMVVTEPDDIIAYLEETYGSRKAAL